MSQQKEAALLFIHGAGGTKSKWRLLRPLLDSIPTYFIDLAGHGTDRSRTAASIEEQAALLNEKFAGQKLIVVGHSMGGLIGIEMAATNPNVVGLVLAASHYALPVHQSILIQLARGSFPEGFFYASYSKKAAPSLIASEKIQLAFNPMHVTLNDFVCCDAYNGKSSITKLSIPILAVYGADDRLVPRNAKDKLLTMNVNAKAEVIEDAGHYVMLEKADQFAEMIRQFRDEIIS